MNLHIDNQCFIVGGASSGFGKATAEALLKEGAIVYGIARGADRLQSLFERYPKRFVPVTGDLTTTETLDHLFELLDGHIISGALVNAGGPPAATFLETNLEDWDAAYRQVMRWKIDFSKRMIAHFKTQQYGRLVFVESVSVKQPIENLVLSNAFRLGVVGFVKTLAQEVAVQGITMNILAPGYHATPAINRLIDKKVDTENISKEAAQAAFTSQIPVGKMGAPDDFAALAVWLLSPQSRYLTGQTISVDGGVVQGVMG
ncbi:MAG: SDR family oxidoreductase [Bacteroidota bacterium]